MQKRILVSGGSIAGPALAYWLNRYGYAVTIVERSPGLRLGGYGVDIRGAATEVAERMGILDEVKASDTQMRGVDFIDTQGKVAVQLHEAAVGNRQGIDIEVMRGDLSQILYRYTKDAITYLWDDSIIAMKEKEDGIEVHFANSASATFDLVIGADGQHSKVRALIFGEELQFTHYLGFYAAIFTLENYLHIHHRQLIYSLPGKTIGMYSSHNTTEAKALFLFQSPPLRYDPQNIAAQKNILIDALKNEQGWQIPRLMKEVETAQDFYFDSVSQIRMPTWSRGRIALVGDAAYAPSLASGQGTSLALVGAYVLAGELYATRGDYHTAYATYEQEMRDFVRVNQKLGESTAKGQVVDSMAKIWLRNQLIRRPRLMRFLFKQAMRSTTNAANRVVLKRY